MPRPPRVPEGVGEERDKEDDGDEVLVVGRREHPRVAVLYDVERGAARVVRDRRHARREHLDHPDAKVLVPHGVQPRLGRAKLPAELRKRDVDPEFHLQLGLGLGLDVDLEFHLGRDAQLLGLVPESLHSSVILAPRAG